MLVSESIKAYLESTRYEGNSDLIDRIQKYGTDLELQVNVTPKGGEPVHGRRNCYTDGVYEWFSFRIPRGAFTNEPEWRDYNLSYELMKHVDSIGSTGWNWKQKKSLWVGFDFDTISGHAVGVGVDDKELDRIRNATCQLDYVEVRQSTGGSGLHLYVYLPETETQNHNEHAALARVTLLQMSQDVGFDLTAKVDVCGSNMWVAAKRSSAANNGFALIKPSTTPFENIPSDWKANLDVVTRKRTKVSIPTLEKSEDDMFSRLASAHRRVDLDAQHIAIREELAKLGCCVWVQDHYLLQTHTMLLKQVMEHTDVNIEGVFETNSPGTNTGEPNCFMFPLDDGVWKVYRFGAGTVEHPAWEQNGRGWTSCFYNRKATLNNAAAAAGSNKTKKGEFEFSDLRSAIKMLKQLSNDPKFDVKATPGMMERSAIVGKTKEGELYIQVKKEEDDGPMQGWNVVDKRGFMTALLGIYAEPDKINVLDHDNTIRCLKTVECSHIGWSMLSSNEWGMQPASNIKMALQAMGYSKGDAEEIMGTAALRAWKRVSVPFAEEYPGNRQWNLGAPQLAYEPLAYEDGTESPHPQWDKILDHIGQSLTEVLKDNAWAKQHSVVTGRQYLEMWISSIFKDPFQPLPYLFLYGPENSGKSIFHEAFSCLVTKGVVFADRALTSNNDFNGELEGCILAVVEEKNIAQTAGAHNRVKQAVTAEELSIRKMRTDSYMVKNTTHWVQMSNEPDACPVFPGDTRIVALLVPPIQTGDEVPKQKLLTDLRNEAPHFLHTLLNLTIPPTNGRLRLPVVGTEFKEQAQEMNKGHLDFFVETYCELDPEAKILLSDFYQQFKEYFPKNENVWGKVAFGKRVAAHHTLSKVRGAGNRTYVQGVKWKERVETN